MLNNSKKRKVLLLSLAVVLLIAVGTTVAYFMQQTDDLTNTFEATSVSCEVREGSFDGEVKQNVAIANTGDIDAYIRAKVVVTWQDNQGNVYGKKPTSEDYTMSLNLNNQGWMYNENDGFYYYAQAVSPVTGSNLTDNLILSCAPNVTGPDGYTLCVEILASAIQADGVSDGVGEPGQVANESAVENAWKAVTVVDGVLKLK